MISLAYRAAHRCPSPRTVVEARGIDKEALARRKERLRIEIEAAANGSSVSLAGAQNAIMGVPLPHLLAAGLVLVVGYLAWRKYA